MKSLVRIALLVLALWLQLAGLSYAKQVYMKDGSILECESFWRRNGWVVVKVNRDIVLEFTPAEVDLKKTFRKATRPAPRLKKKKPSAPVSASTMSKTAGVSEPAVPATVESKETNEAATAPAPQSVKAEPAAAPSNPAPTQAPAATPAPPEQAAAATPAAGSAMTKEEFERRSRENSEMMTQAVKQNSPELMKKAVEAQQSLIKQKNAALPNTPQGGEPGWFKYFLMLMASCLFIIIAMWVVFKKAGESGWKSLVPIYNMYVLMQISGKPGWWCLLLLIPFVGVAIQLLAMISLAEKFGRGPVFGIGLFLLPMIFFPLLAFGGAKYEEAIPPEMNFAFAEEPLK